MNITQNELMHWCEVQFPEHVELLKTLAAIPAPSHHEDDRAAFIKCWLEKHGAQNVFIDEAKNVVLSLGQGPYLAVMAHTDVVFPDTTPLPLRKEEGKLYAPGVGDDTANVVALMLCAKFFLSHPDLIPEPLLIVFNSCEEGLGNLKGVRQIMSDYEGQIHSLVSFDCQSNAVISRAVGSERWKVQVHTRGGHSFSDFGNPNAIAHLSRLISGLYTQQIPCTQDSHTTYNVGLINGGTSVNTIAQYAEMTYEYRSDNRFCLDMMKQQFLELIHAYDSPEAHISIESIGSRPCGGEVPQLAHRYLLNRCSNALSSIYPIDPPFCAASTDANIPLSLGIPAATFGLYRGGGAHTREEYVELDSLTPGLKIAMIFFLGKDLGN